MRYPLKLRVMKKIIYSEHWKRFVEVEKILLEPESPIRTEAQLCNYIFSRHGEGRYMVLAWQKGYEGFWCFWLGEMYQNGFVRDISKNKEAEKLQAQLHKANQDGVDYDERQLIEEEIDIEKRFQEEVTSKNRRGVYGLIKCRPGQMWAYEDF